MKLGHVEGRAHRRNGGDVQAIVKVVADLSHEPFSFFFRAQLENNLTHPRGLRVELQLPSFQPHRVQ